LIFLFLLSFLFFSLGFITNQLTGQPTAIGISSVRHH